MLRIIETSYTDISCFSPRRSFMRPLLIISFCISLFSTFSVKAAERVTFPGTGLTLSGNLYRPIGNGPFPAVVALHGCNGLNFRNAEWSSLLVKQGFIVLFPDSFGSRGIGPQCHVKNSKARAEIEGVSDALAAQKYLHTRTDVKANAILLIGWSHGGTAVLYTIQQQSPANRPKFAKAVAISPNCKNLSAIDQYNPQVPLLLLMGSKDNIMPIEPCKKIILQAQQNHRQVQIIVYPGAGHSFDAPDKPYINPAARADAMQRVPIFFKNETLQYKNKSRTG